MWRWFEWLVKLKRDWQAVLGNEYEHFEFIQSCLTISKLLPWNHSACMIDLFLEILHFIHFRKLKRGNIYNKYFSILFQTWKWLKSWFSRLRVRRRNRAVHSNPLCNGVFWWTKYLLAVKLVISFNMKLSSHPYQPECLYVRSRTHLAIDISVILQE